MTKDESELTSPDKELQAERPEPIISNIDVVPYDRQMEPQAKSNQFKT